MRKEFHRDGELAWVRYFAGDLASIFAEHARDYPGVDFGVVREEGAPAGFRWSFVARYTADGTPLEFITHLAAPDGSDIMSVEYSAAGRPCVIRKFWDELADEDGMMFEYGPDGRNVGVVDLADGDSLKFEGVLAALPEPDFYTDGFALPPQLAGSSIPPVLDRFRS